VTGDGTQQRDFIHVKDLARANYLAAVLPAKVNTAFNIGNSGTMRVIDLARMISDDVAFIPKREGEAEITYANVQKAGDVLGWFPSEKLEDFVKNELNNSNAHTE
jgi:UDP-glucose 4-epimerase